MKKRILVVLSIATIAFFLKGLPKPVLAQEDSSPTPTPIPAVVLPLTSAPASSCTITPPQFSPDLLEITTSTNSATLYFVPVRDDTQGYMINYGYTLNDTSFNSGFTPDNPNWIISHTIDNLYPNTSYYFKVSALNGCASGPWSNVLKAITTSPDGNKTQTFYKGLISVINDSIQISSKGKTLFSIPLPFSSDKPIDTSTKDSKNWLIDTISSIENSFKL